MIFFGANDGMIHAVDARTGYEVWAFIPYNLLPKLRTLSDGQPVEQFDYFVDSSPKIAEVKLERRLAQPAAHRPGPRRHVLPGLRRDRGGHGRRAGGRRPVGGERAAQPVRHARRVDRRSSGRSRTTRASTRPTPRPSPSPTGRPAGKFKMFGDLKATATYAEKTVGFTLVGPGGRSAECRPLDQRRDRRLRLLPGRRVADSGRGAAAPKAGNALYLINADTGKLVGNAVAAAASGGTGCVTVGRRQQRAEERAAGRSDRGRRQRQPHRQQGLPRRHRRQVLALQLHRHRGDHQTADDRHRRSRSTRRRRCSSSAARTSTCSSRPAATSCRPRAPGGTGTFKLYGLKDSTAGAASTIKFAQNLATVSNIGGSGDRRTALDLALGRRRHRVLHDDHEAATTPCADFTANLYAVTYAGGAAYDADGNGKIDKNESPVAKTLAGRATAPFIVDQHLYVGTTGVPARTVARQSRSSATPRTSTTASARSACGSCRGGRSGSGGEDDPLQQLRRQVRDRARPVSEMPDPRRQG